MKSYSLLAPYYDRVMEHVDYDRWQHLILAIDKRFQLRNHRVLELGGGTGKLALLFAEPPWTWCCSDLCFEMARVARQRLSGPVWVQDGRFPSVRPGFGLAVFLYDGINYLLERPEFTACIEAIAKTLVPGGYFLFDVTTETNSLRHFVDYRYTDSFGECKVARHSTYNATTRIQANKFEFFENCGGRLRKTCSERHEQRVFALSDIQKMLSNAGKVAEFVGMWDGFTFKPATLESERVHFLLRRK